MGPVGVASLRLAVLAYAGLIVVGAFPALTAIAVRAAQTAPVANAGRPCGAYRAGQDHVIRTFCDGPGVAHVTLDGREHVVTGGTCQIVAGAFAFNAGVVTGPGATVTPNYVGIATPGTGAFTSAVLAVRLEGRDYLLMQNHGSVGAHGGAVQASGHVVGNGRTRAEVTANFTC